VPGGGTQDLNSTADGMDQTTRLEVCLGQWTQDLNLTAGGVDKTMEMESVPGVRDTRFKFDSRQGRPNNGLKVCLGQEMHDLNLTVDGVDQTTELEVYLGQWTQDLNLTVCAVDQTIRVESVPGVRVTKFKFDSIRSRPKIGHGKCVQGEGHRI
jgi:hypothetical protein